MSRHIAHRLLIDILMRSVDTLLSFPSILFGLAIAAVFTRGIGSLLLALSIAANPMIAPAVWIAL